MNLISVIGMGLSFNDLTEKHLKIIRESDILIGGKRHLSYFPDFKGKTKEITKDLNSVIKYIEKNITDSKMTLLASGDPLFFGIGIYLAKKIGKDKIRVFPNITSVSGAFAKINTSWQDAQIISIHGRDLTNDHLKIIKSSDKIAVLTDGNNSPSWLALKLEEFGITDIRFCVLENLGNEKEKITWLDYSEIKNKEFSEPNIVILIKNKKKSDPDISFGMPESFFEHEKGLITKSEIRAVSLSKLNLMPFHTLWDLGAGSGSVSIEASYFIKTGKIIAVEKNKNRIKNIINNRSKFNVLNLEVVCEELPSGLDKLSKPDRIFIGGGGKGLIEIVQKASKFLNPQGIIVINTVLLSNVSSAVKILDEMNFKTDIVQVQVNRGHKMPWDLMLKSQNPVFIITGKLN